MGMDIILNERIWFPANTNKSLVIEVGSVHHEVECPKIDPARVCAISQRLGEYKGYDLATFLDNHTGGEFNGTEWQFGHDDALTLIAAINEELKEPDSKLDRNDLEDIKKVLTKALIRGSDQFEVFLW